MSYNLMNQNAANPSAPASGKRYWFDSAVDGMAKAIDSNSIISLFDNVKISSYLGTGLAVANTDTKIGTGLYMPANNITAGSLIRLTIMGSCAVSSVGGNSVFTVRFGANNTVADTAQCTVTFATATSGTIVFKLVIEISVLTIGAAGTIYGYATLVNGDSAITGIYTKAVSHKVLAAIATINTTAAGYIGVSYISGHANVTTTFQNIITEIIRQ